MFKIILKQLHGHAMLHVCNAKIILRMNYQKENNLLQNGKNLKPKF